jgi:hypothetical protein
MRVRNVTRGESYQFDDYAELLVGARLYGWPMLWRTRRLRAWDVEA